MLTCQRDRFSLPDDEHYLNCAYMSPMSRAVEAAGIAGVATKRVPSRLTPADFFSGATRARELFASLVHVPDPQRIAIIPSASYGLSLVARNLPVEPGQRIVVTGEQFPSNVYPWRSLAAARGATVHAVTAPGVADGRGRHWNERLLEAITRDTAIVALGHVHWTDGTRFDLAAIGARAREVGAALIIDGTQSVGALPFDVQQLQPDALVCAAYKWLMGPYSIGFAYFGPRFDHGTPLEETWLGREGSEDFGGLVHYRDEYQPGALRYDMGGRANFTLLPMAIAALEQLLEWQPARIQAYCDALMRDAVPALADMGYTVEAPEWRGAHLLGVHLPAGLDVDALGRALTARRVFVSRRGSAVRVSPHVYNTPADVTALVEAFRAAR